MTTSRRGPPDDSVDTETSRLPGAEQQTLPRHVHDEERRQEFKNGVSALTRRNMTPDRASASTDHQRSSYCLPVVQPTMRLQVIAPSSEDARLGQPRKKLDSWIFRSVFQAIYICTIGPCHVRKLALREATFTAKPSQVRGKTISHGGSYFIPTLVWAVRSENSEMVVFKPSTGSGTGERRVSCYTCAATAWNFDDRHYRMAGIYRLRTVCQTLYRQRH